MIAVLGKIGLIIIVLAIGMLAWETISEIGFEIQELCKDSKQKKGE